MPLAQPAALNAQLVVDVCRVGDHDAGANFGALLTYFAEIIAYLFGLFLIVTVLVELKQAITPPLMTHRVV